MAPVPLSLTRVVPAADEPLGIDPNERTKWLRSPT
jgi:hypothetical protein